MSRLLSYCLLSLAVEALSVVNAFGGEVSAAANPAGSPAAGAQGAGAALPTLNPGDPFGGGAPAVPFAASPGAAKTQTAPQPKKADVATPSPKKRQTRVVPPPTLAEPASNVARIKRALDERSQIEFVDTPLHDVIDYLKDFHHIDIQCDSLALKQAGVDQDAQITQNIKGISLRSALRLLLAQIPNAADVTFVIHDEVLLVTTQDKADSFLATEIYDVADLVVCQDSEAKFWDDYETLSDVILENVCPASWSDNGGQGTIKGASLGTARVLVISQTQQVHEQIAAVLKEIRAVAAKKRAEGETGWPRRDPPKRQAIGLVPVVRSKDAPAAPPAAHP